MAAPRRQPKVWFAAALLLLLWVPVRTQVPEPIPNDVPGQGRRQVPIEPSPVDNLKEMFARFRTCWRTPPPSRANPENVSVVVSFDRTGNIFGQPKITYESDQATDNDRLLYRIAVMETLQ